MGGDLQNVPYQQSSCEEDLQVLREGAIAFVHRLEEAVNSHDNEALLKFYSERAVTVSPAYGERSGRSAIRNAWETIFSLFPDWTVKVTDVVLDCDRIAFMGTATATDRNGWFGLPATGGDRISSRDRLDRGQGEDCSRRADLRSHGSCAMPGKSTVRYGVAHGRRGSASFMVANWARQRIL